MAISQGGKFFLCAIALSPHQKADKLVATTTYLCTLLDGNYPPELRFMRNYALRYAEKSHRQLYEQSCSLRTTHQRVSHLALSTQADSGRT